MKRDRLLAYAQLLRLPNVFTAFADICMAGAITGAISQHSEVWILTLLTSGSLYLAGMVWNDVFDRHEDAKTQAFRPIPSGRVRVRIAVILAVTLSCIGVGFAALAMLLGDFPDSSPTPLLFSGLLLAAILLYDAWLKHTLAGPTAMGLCRFLNVLLGLSACPGAVPDPMSPLMACHIAGVVGVYIVGVTWFAHAEEVQSQPRQLLGAATVMLVSVLLALALPLHLKAGDSPWYFTPMLIAFGFHIGIAITNAVSHPDPMHVQTAVKRCILGLVILDAILATAFVGWPGLFILFLLLPARLLGKWVYST